MTTTKIQKGIALALVLMCGSSTMIRADDIDTEKAAIRKVIEASIGWAMNKDFDLLYNSVAQDFNFFIFHPDNASTIVGFPAFKEHVETLFKGDQFKAVSFEVKDLRIGMGSTGDVAWYSCLLDDFGEWNGQLAGWKDCRWTGVLEKRDGKWVIVQMHFSLATDRQTQKAKDSTTSGEESK